MTKNLENQLPSSYKHYICYEITGVIAPSTANIATILNKKGTKASIHGTLDQLPDDAFRNEAIRDVFFLGPHTGNELISRDQEVDWEIQRKKAKTNDSEKCYVYFEFEGKLTLAPLTHVAAHEKFDVALESYFPHQEVDKRHKEVIDGLLSSISLSVPNYQGHKRICRATVIYRKEKPLHILTFNMTAQGNVISPLSKTHIQNIGRHARKLISHQDIVNTSRLISKSFDQDTDRLLAFIASWNGIEILVNRSSNKLEDRLFAQKISASDEHAQDYLDRLKETGKKGLRLNDKFAAMASLIGLSREDRIEFDRIKGIRDRLMHGSDVSPENLPLEECQALLSKVLDRYINTTS